MGTNIESPRKFKSILEVLTKAREKFVAQRISRLPKLPSMDDDGGVEESAVRSCLYEGCQGFGNTIDLVGEAVAEMFKQQYEPIDRGKLFNEIFSRYNPKRQ